jgi:hypothetical protein
MRTVDEAPHISAVKTKRRLETLFLNRVELRKIIGKIRAIIHRLTLFEGKAKSHPVRDGFCVTGEGGN